MHSAQAAALARSSLKYETLDQPARAHQMPLPAPPAGIVGPGVTGGQAAGEAACPPPVATRSMANF